MLQQQGADTAAMHVIGNRHGDLRRPGAAAHQLVAAAADHLARQHRQQRSAVRPELAAYPARFLLGCDRPVPKKRRYRFCGDILACISRTASKSSGRAGRISIVVPSVSRA